MSATKNMDLKRARDRDLYLAFRKALVERGFNSMRDAARHVCSSPAPRFYIEPKRASDLVGLILANVSLINLNDSSRRMAWQLYRNYQAWVKEHPDSHLSRERIIEILVDEPAPEFYVGPQMARKIIYKERKKARAKWGKWREY